jgi:hypothetical protein
LNTAPSHKGWSRIFKDFFFRKGVNLEELNLISTMLDSDIKINAIKEEMISRALSERNHKLPLHTL